MIWCEHCRDHYPEDHYEEGNHKVGREFGPTGEALYLAKVLHPAALEVVEAARVTRERLRHGIVVPEQTDTQALIDALDRFVALQ